MSVRAKKTLEINGASVTITALGGVTASKLILPALRVGASLTAAALALGSKTPLGLMAVSRALSEAKADDVDALVSAFREVSSVRMLAAGSTDVWMNAIPLENAFDTLFAGKPGDIIRWFRESFELNFSDFLDDLREYARAEVSKAQSSSESPKASTGESGESSSSD